MLTAIELDDQAPFKTDKIDDVAANRLLTPELAATDPAIAQAVPQNSLDIS